MADFTVAGRGNSYKPGSSTAPVTYTKIVSPSLSLSMVPPLSPLLCVSPLFTILGASDVDDSSSPFGGVSAIIR